VKGAHRRDQGLGRRRDLDGDAGHRALDLGRVAIGGDDDDARAARLAGRGAGAGVPQGGLERGRARAEHDQVGEVDDRDMGRAGVRGVSVDEPTLIDERG